MSLCKSLLALLADIWRVIGYTYVVYLIMIVLTGMMEGFTFVSVVPLLAAIGVGESAGVQTNLLVNVALSVLRGIGIEPTVGAVTSFVLATFAVNTSFFLVQAFLGAKMQTDYVYAWQSRLVDAFLDARLCYFHRWRHGDIVNVVVTESQRLGYAFYYLSVLLTGIVHCLIFLAIAVNLSPFVTLSILGGSVFLLLITRPFMHRTYRNGAGISAASADFQTLATDFFSGAKLLKATATEHHAAAFLRKVANRLRGHFFHYSFDIQIAKSAFEFGAVAMLAGTLCGSHLLLGADPAITLVVLAIFVRLMPKLVGSQQSLQSLSLNIPAVWVMNEMLSSAKAAVETESKAALPASLAEGAFGIRLQNVTVKYGNLAALRNVDLFIPPGSCVALVGASGAGKSTLVDAILGLVPLAEGKIEINDHALAAIPLRALRRRIGYMTQEPVLFQGTVRENILWGQTNVSDEKALNALRMAAASGLVERFSQGLDTVISNRGASLSGGERQRLALARALVGNPGLLVLDEATSALDAETEKMVLDALRQIKGRATILMIAHRLSSVRLADEIHVLENGAIVESGTWMQLTQEGSRFSKLWRLQTDLSKENKCC